AEKQPDTPKGLVGETLTGRTSKATLEIQAAQQAKADENALYQLQSRHLADIIVQEGGRAAIINGDYAKYEELENKHYAAQIQHINAVKQAQAEAQAEFTSAVQSFAQPAAQGLATTLDSIIFKGEDVGKAFEEMGVHLAEAVLQALVLEGIMAVIAALTGGGSILAGPGGGGLFGMLLEKGG